LSSNPIELAKSTELNKISSNFKFTIYDALFRAINAMEDGTKP
jgi:hypothetical protein